MTWLTSFKTNTFLSKIVNIFPFFPNVIGLINSFLITFVKKMDIR